MKIQVDPKYRSFYYQDVETYPELNLDPKTTALLLVDLQNEFANDEMGEAITLKKEVYIFKEVFHENSSRSEVPFVLLPGRRN
ncbi:MAG: hypothetical protein E6Z25_05895, partial [Negativicoccus succinicivorans]|uniref:hypothetical protein n=1 Tax=Negativicoccus succinicivorans TaxID=620903 RepID=UPI00290FA790